MFVIRPETCWWQCSIWNPTSSKSVYYDFLVHCIVDSFINAQSQGNNKNTWKVDGHKKVLKIVAEGCAGNVRNTFQDGLFLTHFCVLQLSIHLYCCPERENNCMCVNFTQSLSIITIFSTAISSISKISLTLNNNQIWYFLVILKADVDESKIQQFLKLRELPPPALRQVTHTCVMCVLSKVVR